MLTYLLGLTKICPNLGALAWLLKQQRSCLSLLGSSLVFHPPRLSLLLPLKHEVVLIASLKTLAGKNPSCVVGFSNPCLCRIANFKLQIE